MQLTWSQGINTPSVGSSADGLGSVMDLQQDGSEARIKQKADRLAALRSLQGLAEEQVVEGCLSVMTQLPPRTAGEESTARAQSLINDINALEERGAISKSLKTRGTDLVVAALTQDISPSQVVRAQPGLASSAAQRPRNLQPLPAADGHAAFGPAPPGPSARAAAPMRSIGEHCAGDQKKRTPWRDLPRLKGFDNCFSTYEDGTRILQIRYRRDRPHGRPPGSIWACKEHTNCRNEKYLFKDEEDKMFYLKDNGEGHSEQQEEAPLRQGIHQKYLGKVDADLKKSRTPGQIRNKLFRQLEKKKVSTSDLPTTEQIKARKRTVKSWDIDPELDGGSFLHLYNWASYHEWPENRAAWEQTEPTQPIVLPNGCLKDDMSDEQLCAVLNMGLDSTDERLLAASKRALKEKKGLPCLAISCPAFLETLQALVVNESAKRLNFCCDGKRKVPPPSFALSPSALLSPCSHPH